MDIRTFTWEISEPVRSRPLAGLFIAAVTGAAFGAMASTSSDAPQQALLSYASGFALTGLIVGGALPLFRSRILAGLIAWAATAAGLGLMWSIQRGDVSFFLIQDALFWGFVYALSYAVLFWGYRPMPGKGDRP